MKILIIEDEINYIEELKKYIKKFFQSKNTTYEIKAYTDPALFLSNVDCSYDLILLDIELPGMNGIDIAKEIRKYDDSVSIVFVTNMAQYAIKGYEVNAIGFILKPVSYYDLAMKLEQALKKEKFQNKIRVDISSNGEFRFFFPKEIYYVEVMNHTLIFNTTYGVFSTRGTMKKFESILSENGFVRCNNYCIVNLRYISCVQGNEFYLSTNNKKIDEKVFSISRPRKKEFVSTLNNYLEEYL